MERTIVGIDVGTTKIATLVGESATDGSLRIVGVGVAPSRGIKRGVVVNVSEATEAIRLEPTNATAYLYRGSAASYSNNFDQAYDDYNQAIRLEPKLAQAYMNRSKIVRVRGRDVSGQNAADRAYARSLDPNVIPLSSCSSISTTSRGSTTRSVMRLATRC